MYIGFFKNLNTQSYVDQMSHNTAMCFRVVKQQQKKIISHLYVMSEDWLLLVDFLYFTHKKIHPHINMSRIIYLRCLMMYKNINII
jgi:hypothetical protein